VKALTFNPENLDHAKLKESKTKKTEVAVVKEGFIEGINTLRTAKATADMSYFARQGAILTPRNPKIAARALGNATKSAFDRFTAEQLDQGMRSVPHHYIREKAKLYLAPVSEGAKLSAREELFSSNFLENLPTWSVAGPIVRASNRNMAIGLNVLRTSVFDDFYFKFKVRFRYAKHRFPLCFFWVPPFEFSYNLFFLFGFRGSGLNIIPVEIPKKPGLIFFAPIDIDQT